jgi:Uma2 family endonuclease
MAETKPRPLLRIEFEEAAEAYLRSLPPEHFMEATAQSTQRKITLAAFDVIHVARPDIQLFNELLVQYRRGRSSAIQQIVPDNMVVVWSEPIDANGSYDLPLQPTKPTWVMEYVSKHNKRKDYETSFGKYERELKVPYYLLFYPDNQEVSLYRHNSRRYVSVKPDEDGHLVIPKLEIEVALLDGWVRYWFRGELVPVTEELQKELLEVRRQLEVALRRADEEKRRADEENRRADDEKRRADEEKHRADELQQRLEAVERELARTKGQPARADKPTKKNS